MFMMIIILICLLVIMFFTLISLIRQKKIINILSKRIKQKDKKIIKINKEFRNRLKKEVNNNKIKDEIIYEQSKIKSMTELITNIAHQWRQPLSIISTAATAIKLYEKNGMLDIDTVLKKCELIDENVQYLSNIIESFNEFSKNKRNKEVFRVGQVIQIFLKLSQSKTDDSNIKVIYNINQDISIYGYKYEIIQILLNILDNSIDAFLKKDIKNRFVFIDIDSNERELIINIKDTAGGIQKDIINRIFEPYFTTKHQYQGIGLGLYITYIIIKKIDGEIKVQNEEFKHNLEDRCFKGAKFRVSLPIK